MDSRLPAPLVVTVRTPSRGRLLNSAVSILNLRDELVHVCTEVAVYSTVKMSGRKEGRHTVVVTRTSLTGAETATGCFYIVSEMSHAVQSI